VDVFRDNIKVNFVISEQFSTPKFIISESKIIHLCSGMIHLYGGMEE